jgi:hypothetical protein
VHEGGSTSWAPGGARGRAGHQRHGREGAGGGIMVARCDRCEQEMLAGFVVV